MHDHNRRVWDEMVRDRQRFTRPARDEDFVDPLKTIDGLGWLGASIHGQRVLCLAAGGGKHGPLYAAAGAAVTVVDISPGMLELDREVAKERRLELQTVEASMDDLTCFAAGTFDLVVQPVSTCYVPQIGPVYREVSRITKPGGLYISQHKTPQSLQCDATAAAKGYELTEPYYRTGPLPPVVGSRHREEGTLEYLHRWEEILGLLCRAGFVLEDLVEPAHAKADAAPGSWEHRSQFVAPYVRLKARRVGGATSSATTSKLWLPS
ncbi:class I SAM-dependent methyltransferase [Anatilimnocola floriformis]|uniref:class I SAM-dependent methyltransferase n=1 Tax=Anatilimnocola floriformis TaxID=2948575 RepID=UPI0020C34D32|nr:class I SAM-dependent methyltransferase [Anatilimnocola floriformis]